MGDRVVLDTPRWKGEFPLDLADDPLTALEWRWVKKISGYMPMTVEEGVGGLDPDLFIAFAVIALHRAGKIQKAEAIQVADVLADFPADGSTLQVIFDAEEDEDVEADPPQPPSEPPENAENVSELRASGASSSTTSDPLAPGHSRTGTQG